MKTFKFIAPMLFAIGLILVSFMANTQPNSNGTALNPNSSKEQQTTSDSGKSVTKEPSDEEYINGFKNYIPQGYSETTYELISKNFYNLKYYIKTDDGKKYLCLRAESKVMVSSVLIQYEIKGKGNVHLKEVTVIDEGTPKTIRYTGSDASELLNMIYAGIYY